MYPNGPTFLAVLEVTRRPEFWAGVVSLLLWVLRGRRSCPQRLEALEDYRGLLQTAQRLLEKGRLTDAKGFLHQEIQTRARQDWLDSRSRHIPSATRQAVFARDQGRCVRCGTDQEIQFDHIIPFSAGGSHGPENLELLCGPCNRKKAGKIE